MYYFDDKGVRRIVAAVKKSEAKNVPPPIPDAGDNVTIMAKLTAQDSTPYHYEWEQVYLKHDGTWEHPTGGLVGTVANGNFAHEVGETGSIPTDTVVLLIPYAEIQSDNSVKFRWLFNYGGSVPTGQYQFMDLTMVAQNQVGFDFARAHPVL